MKQQPYLYVASSWRNDIQPSVVASLRQFADVYDYRVPAKGASGFHWSDIDPEWKTWTPQQFKTSLDHPIARGGFLTDMNALRACDACILVLPCGRSAHLELGYCVGAGKPTAVLLSDGEPELMYRMVDFLGTTVPQIMSWVQDNQETWLDDRRRRT